MSRLSIARKPVVWQPPGDADPVTFYLRRSTPDELMTIQEVGSVKQEDAERVMATAYQMAAAHVVDWTGVDGDDDQPAECTADNVLALLTDHAGAAAMLWAHLSSREETARTVTRKNGLGDGCAFASPIPASDAEPTVNETAQSTDVPH